MFFLIEPFFSVIAVLLFEVCESFIEQYFCCCKYEKRRLLGKSGSDIGYSSIFGIKYRMWHNFNSFSKMASYNINNDKLLTVRLTG